MWVIAELCHRFVNLDPSIQGERRTSLIAVNAFPAAARHTHTYETALLQALIFFAIETLFDDLGV